MENYSDFADYLVYTGKDPDGTWHVGVIAGLDTDKLPAWIDGYTLCSTTNRAVCAVQAFNEQIRAKHAYVPALDIDALASAPLLDAVVYALWLGYAFVETTRRAVTLKHGNGTQDDVELWHRVTVSPDPKRPDDYRAARYDLDIMTSELWQDEKIGTVSEYARYSWDELIKRIGEIAPSHLSTTQYSPVWHIATDVMEDPDANKVILHMVAGYSVKWGIDKYGRTWNEGSYDPYPSSCECDDGECDCNTQECIICGARIAAGWFAHDGEIVCDAHVIIHCCDDALTCERVNNGYYYPDEDAIIQDDCTILATMRAHGMLGGSR